MKKREELRKLDMNNIIFSSIGLFDSDHEWIHPEIKVKTYEIIYVTEGVVSLFEGDSTYELKKGDLVLLKPDTLHGGLKKSYSRTSFYWLHFSGDFPFEFCGYINNFVGAGMFRELIHYANSAIRDSDALRIITEHILLNIKSAHLNENKNKLAREIHEWIRINVKAGLTAKTVAAHFDYNSEHISRVIKKEYGISLKKIIDKFLCDKFENLLLNTNYSLKEISAMLGFDNDLSSPINFFKYHKKISPSTFRKKYSEIHMNSK